MAKSFTFNPFTGNFDVVSAVTLTTVGSSPNANAATIDPTTQALTLQPADGTNPGILSNTAQSIVGQKTFTTGITGTLTGHATLDLPLTGGTLSGVLDLGSNTINDLADPTSPQQAATKNYVDLMLAGLQPQTAVTAATTANIVATYLNGSSGVGATLTVTATGALVIDGITTAAGQRLLIKNQTTGFQNGIYTVTTAGSTGVSAVLTRAADYNTPADMNGAGLIPVLSGTVNGVTSWQQVATVTTVGTSSLTFTEFSANPSLYLLKSNNLSDVASTITAFNNLSPITTTGDLIIGTGVSTAGRLAIGANNTYLVANGTTASWAALTLTSSQLPTITLTGAVTGSGSGGTIATTYAGTVPATTGGTGLTTYVTGDILYASAANTLARLPIGSNTQVLSITGGVPAWVAAATALTTTDGATQTNATTTQITYSPGAVKAASSTPTVVKNPFTNYIYNPDSFLGATTGYAQSTAAVVVTFDTTNSVMVTSEVGFVANSPVFFIAATSGATLPTGLSYGTQYFLTKNTTVTGASYYFDIAATAGGTKITLSGTPSGTNSVFSTVPQPNIASPASANPITIATSTGGFTITKASGLASGGSAIKFPFTMTAADLGKVFKITADSLSFSSGYATAVTTVTPAPLTIYMKELSNPNVVVQPTGFQVIAGTSPVCSFQSDSVLTSYEVWIYCADPSATSAWTYSFTNFNVSRNAVSIGAYIGAEVAYTPTFAGFGTPTSVRVTGQRIGPNLVLRAYFAPSATTATTASMTLPSGLFVDSSITAPQVLGVGTSASANTVNFGTITVLGQGGGNLVNFGIFTSTSNTSTTAGTGAAVAGSLVEFTATIPIAGWTTTQVLSQDAGNSQTIAARYSLSANAAVAANGVIPFNTISSLNVGGLSFNSSTGIATITVPGLYQINGYAATQSGTSNLYVQQTGSISQNIGLFDANSSFFMGGSVTINAFAGDTIALHITGAVTVTAGTYMQIERVSTGNQQIVGTGINATNTVAYSATPVFNQNFLANRIVLTGNVTSSTLAPGFDGQTISFIILQDATGGRTFVWPTNMVGTMTIGATASKRNIQSFIYSANDGLWLAQSIGITNA